MRCEGKSVRDAARAVAGGVRDKLRDDAACKNAIGVAFSPRPLPSPTATLSPPAR